MIFIEANMKFFDALPIDMKKFRPVFLGEMYYVAPWKLDVIWGSIRCLQEVQGIFWTSYVPSIYVLYPGSMVIYFFSFRWDKNN